MPDGDVGVAYRRVILEKAGYQRIRVQGGVLILRLLDNSCETLDAWHADCVRLMASWQPGKRLRYLHDIRCAEQVTALSLERVMGVLHRMRGVPVSDAKGAVLVRNTTLASLMSSFFKRRRYSNWRIAFFDDEAAALRWLAD